MIAAIVGELDGAEAEAVVGSAVDDGAVVAERKLFYPYYALQLRYSTSSLLGRSAFRIACLVDSRTRLGSTSDPFELETLDPQPRDVMPVGVDASEAERIARRYSGYVLRNRRRAPIPRTLPRDP